MSNVLSNVSMTGIAVSHRDGRGNAVCAATLHADHQNVSWVLHRTQDSETGGADSQQVRATLQRRNSTDADAPSRADRWRQFANCRTQVSRRDQ